MALVDFDIIGDIQDEETIAAGHAIRELRRLMRRHGGLHWRKRKGSAIVRLADGTLRRAEIHWYEATGIGATELKIKRFLTGPL
jgi:hypothetical protein